MLNSASCTMVAHNMSSLIIYFSSCILSRFGPRVLGARKSNSGRLTLILWLRRFPQHRKSLSGCVPPFIWHNQSKIEVKNLWRYENGNTLQPHFLLILLGHCSTGCEWLFSVWPGSWNDGPTALECVSRQSCGRKWEHVVTWLIEMVGLSRRTKLSPWE